MEPFEPITKEGHERRVNELAAEISRRIPPPPDPGAFERMRHALEQIREWPPGANEVWAKNLASIALGNGPSRI